MRDSSKPFGHFRFPLFPPLHGTCGCALPRRATRTSPRCPRPSRRGRRRLRWCPPRPGRPPPRCATGPQASSSAWRWGSEAPGRRSESRRRRAGVRCCPEIERLLLLLFQTQKKTKFNSKNFLTSMTLCFVAIPPVIHHLVPPPCMEDPAYVR